MHFVSNESISFPPKILICNFQSFIILTVSLRLLHLRIKWYDYDTQKTEEKVNYTRRWVQVVIKKMQV